MALLVEMQFSEEIVPRPRRSFKGARHCTKADTWRGPRELIGLATAVHKPLPQTNRNHAPVGTEAIDELIHPCPCCGSPMVIMLPIGLLYAPVQRAHMTCATASICTTLRRTIHV
jgi:hypothetical protein